MLGQLCVAKVDDEMVSGVFYPKDPTMTPRTIFIEKGKFNQPIYSNSVIEIDYSQRAVAFYSYVDTKFYEVLIDVEQKSQLSTLVIAASQEEANAKAAKLISPDNFTKLKDAYSLFETKAIERTISVRDQEEAQDTEDRPAGDD